MRRPVPRLEAALWVLASTFAFAVVFASGKLAGGMIPALQIVLIRYASGFLVALAVATRSPGLRATLATRRRGLHLLRALCGAGGGGATIYAATHMPLADAAALGLTQGVFVVLLALLFLNERVTRRQWLAAALCGFGALIVVRGAATATGAGVASGDDYGLAPALALLGALLVAAEVVLIKILVEGEGTMTLLLHVNGFAAILLIVPAALIWHPVGIGEIAALSVLGPLALSGQLFNVRAYRIADAAYLAPFGYSSVVVAAAIGWLLFGEQPTAASFAGAALIAGGGALLLRSSPGDRKASHRDDRTPVV